MVRRRPADPRKGILGADTDSKPANDGILQRLAATIKRVGWNNKALGATGDERHKAHYDMEMVRDASLRVAARDMSTQSTTSDGVSARSSSESRNDGFVC